ncbi:unnamed protein product [Ilex paraguariensis]|uniref:Uncharacterized protein n=1 Tax=Ilex paraguariensis TaxID=185542 RepID=A0ABC8RAG1_9AQUA
MEDQNMNTKNENDQDIKINWGIFKEISDALELVESRKDGNLMKFESNASKMKEQVEGIRFFLLGATSQCLEKKFCAGEDGNLSAEANNMLEELKQLSSALDMSDPKHEKNLSSIGELSRRLQSRLSWLKTSFLNPLVSHKDTNMEADISKSEEIGKSNEGNMKDLRAIAASEGQSNASNDAAERSKGKRNKKSKKGKKGKGGRKN